MRSTRFALAGLFIPALLAAAAPDQVRTDALYHRAQQHLAARAFDLGLDQHAGFAFKNALQDGGADHVRMHQTYKGVRVFDGEAILHLRNGEVHEVTDGLVRGLDLHVAPSLGVSEALASAHAALAPAGPYAAAPTAELVIASVEGTSHRGRDLTRAALVYHVHTELENGADTRHTDFFIDAHTGRVLESWDTLHSAGVKGSGRSQYSGTVALDSNSVSGGYELRDMTRGSGGTFGNNVVTNLNHATSGNGTIYTDADNTWGDGANYVEGSSTTAANGQTAAVDAAFGIAATWDMYQRVLGRNGIDNTGKASYLRVHYSNSYDNAFWSDSCFCMTFGDGSSFQTLTSIDVAGHEMSHGVCATSANLAYRGESGGLNEANSDIMGTMVEFYGQGGGLASGSTTIPATGGNYTIGEQLATPSFNHPLRYMYKPSLDGSSPDAWSSSTKRLDVHYSSGPANHFFFLLAHGSKVDALSGNIQSPMANGVTSITGLGNDLAAKIWFKALTAYMTSSTTYAGARTATLSACAALGYPSGSAVYTTVNTAWLAVNVK